MSEKLTKYEKLVCVLCGAKWTAHLNVCKDCGGICSWGHEKGGNPLSWNVTEIERLKGIELKYLALKPKLEDCESANNKLRAEIETLKSFLLAEIEGATETADLSHDFVEKLRNYLENNDE